ncbi:hypothetical protein [Maridesulfovibrio hydrothermalis]|uniref:Uncharacterized protein n=1 Tax=Maridesulfovibrio hydrothermalis AM13 = DSM 14728 TaxID=1121451 RepID=L0RE99_9BACT|nr:hypothetical protein [Maridesulfovibrio hydrothermalis]CCO23886.1 conserved protein of unknown function [Maridesulfovibrio hydrothermalis AM13 = DSM 14728]
MAYDVKLFKLINGDMVIGKWDAEANKITDPAILQTVPAQQGVQMMILPFGYPFDNEIEGEIDGRHIIYEYKNCPDDVSTKYLEAASNLTLTAPSGGLGGMGGNVSDISQLLKK